MGWRGQVAAMALAALGAVGCGGAAGVGQSADALDSASGPGAPSTTAWIKTYGATADLYFRAVASAPNGNAVISQQIDLPGQEPQFTLREVDSAGNPVWSVVENELGTADHKLETDAAGDVYAQTECMSPECGDYGPTYLYKYDPQGVVLWHATFNPSAADFALDGDGNAVVATDYRDRKSMLEKLGPDGSVLWTRTFDALADDSHFETLGMAIEPDGGFTIAALVDGTYVIDGQTLSGSGSANYFLQFDANGALRWAYRFASPWQNVVGLETTSAGTIVALVNVDQSGMSFAGTALQPNTFNLLVMERDGTPRFARQVLPDAVGSARMGVDPQGQVTVGYARSDGTGYGLIELDLANQLLWTSEESITPNDPSQPTSLYVGGLAVRPDHSVLVFGGIAGATFSGQQPGDHQQAYLSAVNNGAVPVAYDDFNRSGGLGSGWTVADGSWSDDGEAAWAGSQAYAVSTTEAPGDLAVSVIVEPNGSSYLGVIARANPSAADRDHYAAYVGPDGHVGLARRNGWSYTTLAEGPAVDSSAHRIVLAVRGTDPVQLSVAVDGKQELQFTDSSADRLTSGPAGIFDYNGSGGAFDDFWIQPLAGSSASGTGGGTGGSSGSGPLVAVAQFDGSSGQGTAPDTEDLDGTGSYSTDPNVWITACHWDFGDGSSANDCWVEHTYQTAGTYHPTLTVTGSDGSTASASLAVTVSASSTSGTSAGSSSVVAVAHFDGSTGQGTAPDVEDLDGTGSYSNDPNVWITTCQWDFGDGASSNDCWVEHTYQTAGTYHPKLTVTGSDGSTSSASLEVDVTAG